MRNPRAPILPTLPEMRAASRLLRSMLHSDLPYIQRFVAEAIHDARPADALSFAQKLEAALLASEVPQTVPTFSHARPSPVGVPTLDPRD